MAQGRLAVRRTAPRPRRLLLNPLTAQPALRSVAVVLPRHALKRASAIGGSTTANGRRVCLPIPRNHTMLVEATLSCMCGRCPPVDMCGMFAAQVSMSNMECLGLTSTGRGGRSRRGTRVAVTGGQGCKGRVWSRPRRCGAVVGCWFEHKLGSVTTVGG